MVTRRCSERRFFMRPDSATNNAFIFCLAIAAQRYNVDVIFTAAAANHHHTGIVDRDGRLPEFLAYFHKLFAKHQNALRGRWENHWSSEQASAVELVGSDDVLDKMIYALTNPVKDNLVSKIHHWPGVDAFSAIVNNVPLVATKPVTFFRKESALPNTVSLSFKRPPGFEALTHEAFASLLRSRVEKVEADAEAERAKNGTRILGRKTIRKQHWNDRPASHEPRRQLSPRVACKDKWRRIEALQRNKEFLDAYKAARIAFLAGQDVHFPHGTYWLKRFAGVSCVQAPAPN
jgi:putative transposase